MTESSIDAAIAEALDDAFDGSLEETGDDEESDLLKAPEASEGEEAGAVRDEEPEASGAADAAAAGPEAGAPKDDKPKSAGGLDGITSLLAPLGLGKRINPPIRIF